MHVPVQSYADHCYDTAGSCGLTEGTIYDVYVVAQDFVTPTPNLQTVPTERTLDTSDSATFTCTAGIFTSNLKPDIVPVSGSPGLPTSQLYGNWTATRWVHTPSVTVWPSEQSPAYCVGASGNASA